MPVRCLLCGEAYDAITESHLKSSHGVTLDDYRRMFPGAETYSEEAYRRLSRRVCEGLASMSPEARDQMRKLTPMQREEKGRKISEANTGGVRTDAERERISEAHVGVMSEVARRSISEANTGNRYASGYLHSGWYHTEGARQLMAEAQRAHWRDPEYLRRQAEGCQRKPTQPELEVQYILDKHFPNEWKYVGDYQVWIGGRNPDFINIDGKKQVIEVFGVYWHSGDEAAERVTHYRSFGFDCLVVWEYDTCNETEVIERIRALSTQ